MGKRSTLERAANRRLSRLSRAYIAADKQNNVVVIKFDKPMDWVAMPPEQAIEIIKSLTQKVAELGGGATYVKVGYDK